MARKDAIPKTEPIVDVPTVIPETVVETVVEEGCEQTVDTATETPIIEKKHVLTRMGTGMLTSANSVVDLVVKIYNDFRLAVLACLFALLYMTYELLMRITTIPADQVSVEMLGVVASFLAAVAANIKFFLEERKSDAEDKREHDQWMERQRLRIEVAREGLDVELEPASD